MKKIMLWSWATSSMFSVEFEWMFGYNPRKYSGLFLLFSLCSFVAAPISLLHLLDALLYYMVCTALFFVDVVVIVLMLLC